MFADPLRYNIAKKVESYPLLGTEEKEEGTSWNPVTIVFNFDQLLLILEDAFYDTNKRYKLHRLEKEYTSKSLQLLF